MTEFPRRGASEAPLPEERTQEFLRNLLRDERMDSALMALLMSHRLLSDVRKQLKSLRKYQDQEEWEALDGCIKDQLKYIDGIMDPKYSLREMPRVLERAIKSINEHIDPAYLSRRAQGRHF